MSELTSTTKFPDSIVTNRLLLRAPQLNDARALQTLANNKTIHEALARLPFPYTKDHALDFIKNIARREKEHSYAIINENNNFIGIINLHFNKNEPENEPPELGYWLGEPFWKRGYAIEAVTGVLSSAFCFDFQPISARSLKKNTRSINLLKKAGFEEQSTAIGDCCQHRDVSVTRFLWRKKP